MSQAITDAGNAGVQEVVFLSSDVNDIIEFLNAAAIGPDFNGPDPVEIFLADAGADPYLLQNTQDLAGVLYHRVRGTRPKVPDGDVFEQFQTAYSGKWGEDPSDAVFAPYTYDAAWLVLYGHAWSLFQEGAIGGTGIARGMRQVSAVGADVVPVRASSWEDVVASFRDGTAVDLEGASGALQFDPITGETLTPIEVWVIDQAGEGFEPVASCEALESGLECTDLTATTTTP